MTREDWARLLVGIGAVELRTDPRSWFTWVSGKRAPIYCDNRLLISYPRERARVADGLAELIREGFADCEVVAGTATAGIPHAAWVAERLECPMVYVRGEAKRHGQGKRVEGRPLRGERVVLVEDLISMGGSSCSAVEALNEEGGKVLGVVAIFSYGFPQATERFRKSGIGVRSLTDYEALLASTDLEAPTRKVLLDWRAG